MHCVKSVNAACGHGEHKESLSRPTACYGLWGQHVIERTAKTRIEIRETTSWTARCQEAPEAGVGRT